MIKKYMTEIFEMASSYVSKEIPDANEDLKLDFAFKMVELSEKARKDGNKIGGTVDDGGKEINLDNLIRESYQILSEFYIKKAFKSIQTEELTKDEIARSFRTGIRYAERGGNRGQKARYSCQGKDE